MEWTKFQPVVLIPAPSVPNSSQSITASERPSHGYDEGVFGNGVPSQARTLIMNRISVCSCSVYAWGSQI